MGFVLGQAVPRPGSLLLVSLGRWCCWHCLVGLCFVSHRAVLGNLGIQPRAFISSRFFFFVCVCGGTSGYDCTLQGCADLAVFKSKEEPVRDRGWGEALKSIVISPKGF